MKKRNHKNYLLIFPAVIFVTLLVVGILTLALPAKELSENENRNLAQMPSISMQAVNDGTFQKDLDSFLSDQIPLREVWVRMGSGIKKLLGRKELNDVYLGKDGYYFQAFTEESYSSSRMISVFQMMEDLYQKHSVPTELLMVPSPGTILEDKLPSNAPYYDADKVYSAADQLLSFPVIDLRDTFLSQKDSCQLYYRTDHHWTTEGARLAYETWTKLHGTEPRHYDLQTVSEDFHGTLYSKVMDSADVKDTIKAPADLPKVTITYDNGEVTSTPFRPEFLEKKDQYAYFFGGNFGKVVIDTGADSDKTLLIFKDSFANSFVPFLFEDYGRIVMVDLRYYGGPVEQLFEEYDVSQVLYLFETTNLLTDTGILRIGQ